MSKFKNILTVLIIWTISIMIVSYLGSVFFPTGKGLENVPFLQKWSNWDGGAYLNIAQKGYGSNESYAFFPFYPIVIHIVAYLTFGNYLLSGMIISWMSLLFALFFLYKLVLLDFNKKIAEKTIKYFLVFPFSFFLIATYTEPIFLFLAISSFYFFRKSLYLKSSISGLFVTATRVTGIAVFPALVLEAIESKKILKNKSIFSLALIPLGLAGYMVYQFIEKGNPLYFVHVVNVYWKRPEITYPFKVLLSYLKSLMLHPHNVFASRDGSIIALEFIFSVLFLALIIFVWYRVRKSYALYAFVAWTIPLMTGRTGCMLRYVLVLFPCFIALALLGNKYRNFDKLYFLLSSMLLALFTISFINGDWIA